jgi:hypothetical protein
MNVLYCFHQNNDVAHRSFIKYINTSIGTNTSTNTSLGTEQAAKIEITNGGTEESTVRQH